MLPPPACHVRALWKCCRWRGVALLLTGLATDQLLALVKLVVPVQLAVGRHGARTAALQALLPARSPSQLSCHRSADRVWALIVLLRGQADLLSQFYLQQSGGNDLASAFLFSRQRSTSMIMLKKCYTSKSNNAGAFSQLYNVYKYGAAETATNTSKCGQKGKGLQPNQRCKAHERRQQQALP